MAKKIGICALCKVQNIELRESHIIPKLAYKRTKAFQTSRFRNYYDLNVIFQDGEKKPLLCQSCETFFSGFETKFTNNYLDKYLKDKSTMPLSYPELESYIISVAWRVLHDDLFLLNSFSDKSTRSIWEEHEKKLHSYLDNLRLGNEARLDFQIKNYIFTLDSLGYDNEVISFLEPSLFGYSVESGDHSKYFVFTHYNGLVIVTVYRPKNVIVVGRSIFKCLIDMITSKYVKDEVKKEIDYQIQMMLNQKFANEKILDSGLRTKILERYKNSKPIR